VVKYVAAAMVKKKKKKILFSNLKFFIKMNVVLFFQKIHQRYKEYSALKKL